MTHNLPRAAALILLCIGFLAGRMPQSRFGDPGPAYPTALAHGAATLDIQVTVLDAGIEFTNTSTITFENPLIWLNRWYSASPGLIAPGETIILPLNTFADEHGRSPSPGGFFASQKQEPIVLVEIEHASVLAGLVVVETADR